MDVHITTYTMNAGPRDLAGRCMNLSTNGQVLYHYIDCMPHTLARLHQDFATNLICLLCKQM